MSDATPNENQETSVDPESIEGIFLNALTKSTPEELAVFLEEACGENDERRQRIDALLRAYNDAGSFLETPPTGVPSASDSLDFDFLEPSDDPGLLGTLGPYEIYEVIGRGGMGIVFRARDPKLNRVVAVKVLAPELAANPNAKRRFVREAQAAAAVSHPHVVTIHAVDEDEKIPYLVMECIVGQSLQQKLDKVGSLRLTEVLRISKQIAEGLSAAHKQGLIHRDIKPANILLENGVERVKITDFGLARTVDDVSVTRTGEVAGSPQFMSPEQAMGQRVDQRSDLFSLGCVMYAMCAGRSPFRATSIAAAIRRVCDDDPRPIEEINAEVPEWMIAIIEKLLDKDPDQRFQSADEVMQVLEDHLAGVQSSIPRKPRAVQSRQAPSNTPALQASPQSHHPRQIIGILVSVLGAFICLGGILLTTLNYGNEIQFGSASFAPLLFIIVGAVVAFAGQLLNQKRVTCASWLIILIVLLGPAGFAIWLLKKNDFEEADRKANEERQIEPTQQFTHSSPHETPILDRLSSSLMRIALLGPIFLLIGFCLWAAMPTMIEGAFARLVIMGIGPALFGATIIGWFSSHLKNREWGWEAYYKGVCASFLAVLVPPVWLVGIPVGFASLWVLNRQEVIHSYREKGKGEAIQVSNPNLLLDIGTFIGALLSVILILLIAVNLDGGWSGVNLQEGMTTYAGFCLLILPFRGELFRGRYLRDLCICTCAAIVTGLGIAIPGQSGVGGQELIIVGAIASILFLVPWFIVWRFLIVPTQQKKVPITIPLARPTTQTPLQKWSLGTRLLLGALVAVFILGVQLAVPQVQQAFLPQGSLVIHHYGDVKPKEILIDGRKVNPQSQSANYTSFLKLKPGVHRIQISLNQNEGGVVEVNKYEINIRPGATHEIPLRMPVKMNAGMDLGPASSEYGGLILEIPDPDLNVMLLKSGPEAAEFSPRILSAGEHQVPAGKYQVIVLDDLVGWLMDMERDPQGTPIYESVEATYAGWKPHRGQPEKGIGLGIYDRESRTWTLIQYSIGTIEIKPGEFESVVAKRDLKAIALHHEKFVDGKFYRFLWNGKKYSFSAAQARVIQELLQAYADGRPAVMESNVLETLNMNREEPFSSLSSLFNDGRHPGWQQLVNWTKEKGDASLKLTKLINPPKNSFEVGGGMAGFGGPPTAPVEPKETGAVILKVNDSGLTVNVSQNEFGLFQNLTKQTTSLPVGKYYVMVFDKKFGWGSTKTTGSVAPPTYYDEQFEVTKGEFADLELGRNWKKLAAVEPVLMEGFYPFVWYGKDFVLSKKQSEIVQQLFKALAEEKIAVDVDQLVESEDAADEIKRIFNNGNHPAWNGLVELLGDEKLRLNYSSEFAHPTYKIPEGMKQFRVDFTKNFAPSENVRIGRKVNFLVTLDKAKEPVTLIQDAAIFSCAQNVDDLTGAFPFSVLLTEEQAEVFKLAIEHTDIEYKLGEVLTEFPKPTLNEETLKALKQSMKGKEE